jgi:L-ascorbate metabolism protein UlaG (beta-lactamase superfamily)
VERGGRPDALTYVGHATVLAELDGVRILTDPLLVAGIAHVRRRTAVPRADDLGSLGAILISHAHHDHLDSRSLRLLTQDCPVIVPSGAGPTARRAGAENIIEMRPGDCTSVGNVVVEAVPASHDGRRFPIGPPVPALGYLLRAAHRQVYFAGDTDLFPGMAALAGRVDVALLPIWGWGPSLPAGHLDPLRAAEAVALIRPQMAVPIHWGTLRAWGAQRGLDPLAPTRAFAHEVGRVAPATEVRVVLPGHRIELPSASRP